MQKKNHFHFLLSIGVLLTSLAYSYQIIVKGSPYGSWFLNKVALDGVHLIWAERFLAFTILALATLSVIKNHWRWPLVFLAIIQGGNSLLAYTFGGGAFPEFALATEATRAWLPLILALYRTPVGLTQRLAHHLAHGVLFLTFAFHGMEAIYLHPEFFDLIQNTTEFFFGLIISQEEFAAIIMGIGLLDLVVALVVLLDGSKESLLWSSFWGALTALSRFFTYGPLAGLMEVLIRSSHFILPWGLYRQEMNVHENSSADNLLVFKSKVNWEKISRGASAASVALVFLFAQNAVSDPEATGPYDIRHPRVVFERDPAHEARILVTSSDKNLRHTLYLDDRSHHEDLADYKYHFDFSDSKKYFFGGGEVSHWIDLSNLKANTAYYFVVSTESAISDPLYFVTASNDENQVKLLLGGDSRSDRSKRREMNRVMHDLFSEMPEILALVHGGDYVENGLNYKQFSEWLDDHQETTLADGRVLPIIPTRGNHEFHPTLFNAIFGRPGGGDNYFLTRIGELNLITLNTEISHTGAQQLWLESTLFESAQEAKWIVTNYHRPVYPAVKSPGKGRKEWVPYFDTYQVDLSVESDGHTLKRTAPIRYENVDASGTVYVGEGGLGVPQRVPEKSGEWYFANGGYATSSHHVQLLSFETGKMIFEVIDETSSFIDRYEFSPKARKKRKALAAGKSALFSPQYNTCLNFPEFEKKKARHHLCLNDKNSSFQVIDAGNGRWKLQGRDQLCLVADGGDDVEFEPCRDDERQVFSWGHSTSFGKEVRDFDGKCLSFLESGELEESGRFFKLKRKKCELNGAQFFNLKTAKN